MKFSAVFAFLFISGIWSIPSAGEDSMLLKINDPAPDFELMGSHGDTVRLKDFIGKNHVVLIFYPGDETPGCTKQLCAIRDDFAAFKEKNAVVFGINPGNTDSHRKFVGNHGFQFPLLVDENRAVAKRYGCNGWPLLKRTVYVIDPAGKIIFAKRGKPADEEILQSIPDKIPDDSTQGR
jgi:thioredoxin-dependent peroxiredoxin